MVSFSFASLFPFSCFLWALQRRVMMSYAWSRDGNCEKKNCERTVRAKYMPHGYRMAHSKEGRMCFEWHDRMRL
jgi:hypothetical protein